MLQGHVPTLHGLAEPGGSPVPAPVWPAVTLAREPRVLRGPVLVTGDSPEEGRGTQWQQGGVHEGGISDDREEKKLIPWEGLEEFVPQCGLGEHHPVTAGGRGTWVLPAHCFPQSQGPHRVEAAWHREG